MRLLDSARRKLTSSKITPAGKEVDISMLNSKLRAVRAALVNKLQERFGEGEKGIPESWREGIYIATLLHPR